jgi:putative tryptophan/tyrosine transport system substrate-binding protein
VTDRCPDTSRHPGLNRRGFVPTILAGLIGSRPVNAQQMPRPHRVGWLTTVPHPFLSSFREGMKDFGYVQGQNLLIDERYADGKAERLPRLLEDLLRLRIDVLATSGSGATKAARASAARVAVVVVTEDPSEIASSIA